MESNIQNLVRHSEPKLDLDQELELGRIIQGQSNKEPAWAKNTFTEKGSILKRYPPFPKEPKAQKAWAIARLSQANIKWFVKEMIRRSRSRVIDGPISTEDLASSAVCIAQAARTYDPSKGFKFSTHLYSWVHNGVNEYFREAEPFLKPPHYIFELRTKICLVSAEFVRKHQRYPAKRELLAILKERYECPVTLEQIKKAIAFTYSQKRSVYLSSPVCHGDTDLFFGDAIAASNNDGVYSVAAQLNAAEEKSLTDEACLIYAEDRKEIATQILGNLAKEDRDLLLAYFGFSVEQNGTKGRMEKVVAAVGEPPGPSSERRLNVRINRVLARLAAQVRVDPRAVISPEDYAIATLESFVKDKKEVGRRNFLRETGIPNKVLDSKKVLPAWERYQYHVKLWQLARLERAIEEMQEPVPLKTIIAQQGISRKNWEAAGELTAKYYRKLNQIKTLSRKSA